ncbi:MAG: signal recognition particle-docking protein FtsY [Oscillatoriales cyanobacterium SM2_2_1]|nr:signal recognition particle-docking protein FtsY [Oscillatoriales cyanobacterium SM2_2_1]
MVFNWFKRSFDRTDGRSNDSSNDPQEERSSDQSAGSQPPEPSQQSLEPPVPQPDLLAWAKTAYSSLQQQSGSPIESEPPIAEPSDAPSEQETVPADGASTELLPFWLQTETDAERQARLESLAAPEPFDESFLWSAQVLAAQGRQPTEITVDEIKWLKRLRQGLDKTRLSLINQLKSLVGQGPLDADAVEAIEALLLQADVGVAATDRIMAALQQKLRQEILPPDLAIAYLKELLQHMLDAPGDRLLVPEKNQLNIWLITGVNGAGKTTTIGKLAHTAQQSGYRTLIAAADTFRAAAVEQVKTWGERAGVDVIANPTANADPAAVVFDAITAAQARNTELLLVDTAGRLQNKKNLMDELSKIRRIIDKKATHARIESLLVLDATLGQNGLKQAEVFSKSAGITGVVLTKLDGTAKGGVAIAVVEQLGLPIRFIGAGEGIQDLRPFSSYEFIEALING